MRKIALGLFAILFLVSAVFLLPAQSYSGSVNAAYRNSPYTFVPPISDPAREAGRHNFGENAGQPQDFVLQGRYFNSSGVDITNMLDPNSATPLRPVFSHADMQRIEFNELAMGRHLPNGNVENATRDEVVTHNFGMIMLDMDNVAGDNYAVLELLNLTNFNSAVGETWLDFTAPNGTTQTHTVSHAQNPFMNMGDVNNDILRGHARDNVGSIVYNNRVSVMGHFQEEGFYRFRFRITSFNFPFQRSLVLEFGFYIVHSTNYTQTPELQGSTIRQRGDSSIYYFNFDGENPFIQYDSTRFNVEVNARNFGGAPVSDPVYSMTGDTRRMEFLMIGSYEVNSQMIFSFRNTEIPVINFNRYNFTLNIFGFQAYYEHQNNDGSFTTAWMGGNFDGTQLNADISMQSGLPSDAAVSTLATAESITEEAAFQILMQQWADSERANPSGFRPVATNSGPVQLFGNATLETDDGRFLSTVSFNNGRGWQQLNFVPNRPFEAAGEYIVTLYYVFPAATNFNREVLRQVFHFRIVNSMDIRVAHYENSLLVDIFHINDFVGRRIPINGSFFVFMDGMEYLHENQLSPFITRPRVELEVTNFAGVHLRTYNDFDLSDLANQFNTYNLHNEGHYTFRIFHGRGESSVTTFTVTVDNSPVGDFRNCPRGFRIVNTGGTELIPTNAPENFAIWGAGADEHFGLELHWGLKESGITFSTAEVEVFSIERDTDFALSDDFSATNLLSPYMVNVTPSNLNFRIIHVLDQMGNHIGYRVDQRFSGSGIYIFRITDAAQNVSTFVLIIDNSSAAFAQDPIVSTDHIINMVPNANIGFGENKIIYADLTDIEIETGMTLANMLSGTNIANNDGIVIPMQRVEHTTAMGEGDWNIIFERRQTGIFGNHHNFFNEEEYHRFRSYDYFGNVSHYSILISSDHSRGVVLSDAVPDIGIGNEAISATANIVRPGGITNRDFVSFSFLQREYTFGGNIDEFIVDRIEMTFFPRTHQRFYYENGVWIPNQNYPFSATPSISNEVIYQRMGDVEYGLEFIPINQSASGTLPGMYMITRHFDDAHIPSGSEDTRIRNYFFIVDNNQIITNDFESDIRINFGNGHKIATQSDFQRHDNHNMQVGRDLVLQTNMNAVINLPLYGTKYGHSSFAPDGTGVPQSGVLPDLPHNFGSPVMQIPHQIVVGGSIENRATFPFNALLLNLEIQHSLDGGETFDVLADRNSSNASTPITAAGMYRLVFTDGSGGLTRNGELIGANRSEILMERIGAGSNGAFFRNGRRITLGSTQFTQDDILTFSYIQTDPNTFFADVWGTNIQRIMPGQTPTTVIPAVATRVSGTATIIEYTIPPAQIMEGAEFRITMQTVGHIVEPDTFSLIIDNTPPTHNLNAIQDLDTLWQNLEFRGGLTSDEFIFAIPNWFTFSRPATNHRIDALTISYFEVSESLTPIGGEYDFTYNYYRPIGERLSFSQIIRPLLQPTDNRFFRIVETDEAGNRREYFVNLRGEDFIENISAIENLTSNDTQRGNLNQYNGNIIYNREIGQTNIFGRNITITNVNTFWLANPFFQISTPTQIFRRHNQTATFGDRIDTSTITEARPTHLLDELNRWLRATDGQMVLTINNGFETWDVNVFQIDDNQMNHPIITATRSDTSLVIRLENWASLPLIFRHNPLLISVTVTDMLSNAYIGTFNFPGGNNASGWEITVGDNSATREVLIELTDVFGRHVVIEHNGVFNNHRDFIFNGRPILRNGIYYTGDAEGVELVYTTQVHNVQIFRDGVPVSAMMEENINRVQRGNLMHYYITPPTDATNSSWRVVITQIASGRVVFDHSFVFYTVLPEVRFTNLSGYQIQIQPDGEASDVSLNGIVEVHLTQGESLFASQITYTRIHADPETGEIIRDSNTTRRGQTRFTLAQKGAFEVEIINAVGTRKVYRLVIEDVDNTTYRIFFNYEGGQEELRRSPEPYNFNGKNISQYFVRGNASDMVLGTSLIIERTLNYPRIIVGNAIYTTETHSVVGGIITTHIYALESEITGTRIYIAVSAIPTGAINQIPQFGLNMPSIATGPNHQNAIVEGSASGIYALYTNIGPNGIVISVNRHTVAGTPRSFNAIEGNVVFVDYYYNGAFAGSFRSDESLTIHARNYGAFEFVLRDVAGFQRTFTYNPLVGAPVSADRFTLYNLSRTPILLNGDIVIPGMVYNDQLVIDVMHFSHSIQNDINMFVTNMRVWLDGREIQTVRGEGDNAVAGNYFVATEWHSMNRWTFNQPGNYTFEIQFRYRSDITINHRFNVQLVDSTTMPRVNWLQSFTFTPTTQMEIETIRRNGSDITQRFSPSDLEVLRLDSREQIGTFQITVRINDDIRPSFTKDFTVFINFRQNITNIIESSLPWGTSTTGEVAVFFTPIQINIFFPNATFAMYRDGAQIGDSINVMTDTRQLAVEAVSLPGQYRVVLRSETGDIIFSNGFEIYEGMSGIAILLIILAIGVVAVGGVLFFVMRNRMKVK